MAKLFDVHGNEVDAITAEELKEKNEEAIAEYLKNNPDKTSEVNKLKADLDELNKKLEEGGMNEGQKARLKADKDAAEAKLSEKEQAFMKEISDLKDMFTGGIKNKALDRLSKGDKDVKEKIELRFNSLMKTGDYKNDEAGITQAMTEATLLATGSKPAPGFLDNASAAGDRGDYQDPSKGTTPESDNSKSMRAALGIKDSDAAKYEAQVKSL